MGDIVLSLLWHICIRFIMIFGVLIEGETVMDSCDIRLRQSKQGGFIVLLMLLVIVVV